MFDDLEDAVRAHRAAAVEHHEARDRRDNAGMDAAIERIRTVADYLRARRRPELIHPLTMEWVTEGRDAAEHAHYRTVVDKLLSE